MLPYKRFPFSFDGDFKIAGSQLSPLFFNTFTPTLMLRRVTDKKTLAGRPIVLRTGVGERASEDAEVRRMGAALTLLCRDGIIWEVGLVLCASFCV